MNLERRDAKRRRKMQKKTMSKVYLANNENKVKFKEEKNVIFSKDGMYMLVYTEEDLTLMNNYWWWTVEYEHFSKLSYQDFLYENVLVEAGIKEEFDPSGFCEALMKIDKEKKRVIHSWDSPTSFALIIFDENDSKTNGATAIMSAGQAEIKEGPTDQDKSRGLSDKEGQYIIITRKEEK
jgi:hypothetical protein